MATSSSPVTRESSGFLRFTGDLLASVFDGEFAFWQPGEPWTAHWLAVSDEGLTHCCLPLEQAAVGQRALETREPLVVPRPDGGLLVALPVRSLDGSPLVAAAAVQSRAPEILRRLGRLVLGQMELWDRLDSGQQELESCADRIRHDLEELILLRRLSNHLDAAEARRDTWNVSQMMLLLLAPLIRAEAMVLLPENRAPENRIGCAGEVGAVRVGSSDVGPEACWDLVEQYGSTATAGSCAKDHFAVGAEEQAIPGVEQFLLAPLAHDDRVLGWLVAVNCRGRHQPASGPTKRPPVAAHFTPAEASLLRSAASMLAAHAHDSEVFQEKEDILVGVVRSLVSAIETKDPYTCGHSERVALIARRLAVEMGLTADEARRMYLAGLLHDVGKIGVSDAVLRKPSRLTPEEFDEIRRHPDQGWFILRELEELDCEIRAVLHHHEMYDGRGYPDHLAGEAIPLAARIVAVADSYDAMASDRPYRRRLAQEQIERNLRDGSGTQWDPKVVDAFFRALPDIMRICRDFELHARRAFWPALS